MVVLADTKISEMSDSTLKTMLEDIRTELYERRLKSCKNAMIELCQTIEQIAKKFNLVLIDNENGAMYLRDIRQILSDEFDTADTLIDPSIYEEKEK